MQPYSVFTTYVRVLIHAEGATCSLFRQAVRLADGASHGLLDSHAAVYEKQNRLKDALRDAKTTIDIAPTKWQGYFRSARLFASVGKLSAALRMRSLALERLGNDPKHDGRRRELMALRCELEARTKSPIAVLPVELLLMVFDLVCMPIVHSLVCRRWCEVALSHPTLWHSLVLAEPPKSLGGVVFKPLDGHQMIHPDDLAMRSRILDELRCLDTAHVKTCHLEDVDVMLLCNACFPWGGF